MSAISFLPVNIKDAHSNSLIKMYQFVLENGHSRFKTWEDFKAFKHQESELENKSEFLIVNASDPIGLIEIKKLYEQPEPIFTLSIVIEENELQGELKDHIRKWMIEQLDDRKTDRIIAYESKSYMEQFYLKLGGRVVNWLQFYELWLENVDAELLNYWSAASKLEENKLKLQYFDKIPDQLFEEHARLHTELSNDIQRQDYSWEVVKTASYTKQRQQLLAIQGKRAEIGYLFDEEEHIVGMTKIVFDPETPHQVYQTMTGVTKSLRGRALAKFLKANMIKRIMKYHSEVEVIETDCMLGNDPMISINEKIGFRRKLVPDEKEIILDKLFLQQI